MLQRSAYVCVYAHMYVECILCIEICIRYMDIFDHYLFARGSLPSRLWSCSLDLPLRACSHFCPSLAFCMASVRTYASVGTQTDITLDPRYELDWPPEPEGEEPPAPQASAVGAAPAATHASAVGGAPAGTHASAVGAAPAATGEAEEARWYVIWHIPERPDFFGVVRSAEPGAWDRVACLLRNGMYPGSRAHLRRATDYAEAQELYRREYRRHGLPAEAPFHRLP